MNGIASDDLQWGDEPFRGCEKLTTITLPHGISSIVQRAFSECSSLTRIDIPNSVTSIGNRAFYGCSALISIDIPNDVTSIEEYTFSDCSSLTFIANGNSNSRIYYNHRKYLLWGLPKSRNTTNEWYCKR